MKTYKLRLDNKDLVVCEYEGKMPMQDISIKDDTNNPLGSTLKYLKELGDWEATEIIYPIKKDDISKFVKLISDIFSDSDKHYTEMHDALIIGVEIPSEKVKIIEDSDNKFATIINETEEIFRWLLGYTDFPIKQEEDGNYYWRKELRKKLLEIGINIRE